MIQSKFNVEGSLFQYIMWVKVRICLIPEANAVKAFKQQKLSPFCKKGKWCYRVSISSDTLYLFYLDLSDKNKANLRTEWSKIEEIKLKISLSNI